MEVTVEEMARRENVSARTIRDRIKKGQYPGAYRPGRRAYRLPVFQRSREDDVSARRYLELRKKVLGRNYLSQAQCRQIMSEGDAPPLGYRGGSAWEIMGRRQQWADAPEAVMRSLELLLMALAAAPVGPQAEAVIKLVDQWVPEGWLE